VRKYASVIKTTLLLAMLSVSQANGQQTSAGNTVNVTITKQKRMLVQVWVNGSRGNFLVDTGAGNSYMGEKFAGSLHLRSEEGGYSYNVLGSMRFDVVDVNSLELGANRVPVGHGLIHVSNLGWANKGSANSIILIHNLAIIDCAQSRISFGGQGASFPSRAAALSPRRGDEIAVIAFVNGVRGTFIVDTGYNVSLVTPEFAAALGGKSRSRVIAITSLEVGVNRQHVRLGEMIVTGGINVANQGYVEQGEPPYDGVLGMDFLLSNHVVIDCRQKQLHFD
jgi:predicted aspartyl protease